MTLTCKWFRRMKRILCVIAAFLFVAGCGLQAKTYMVCVGIADYPDTKNDLRVSAGDAVTVSKIFEKNNNADVVLLTDDEATVSATCVAMRTLFAKAGEDDVVIFFFSGHGVPGCFVCHDGYLKYKDITDIMAASKAQQKEIFADASFSGKARMTNRRNSDYSPTNVMFFFSSRDNEYSQERRGWKNSLFTAYLERGLRGGADTDRNRTITARELFDFVSKGVKAASEGKQHPVMWGKFDDDMPVIEW